MLYKSELKFDNDVLYIRLLQIRVEAWLPCTFTSVYYLYRYWSWKFQQQWPPPKGRRVIAQDNKVHGANMGPTWVLSAPDGPHVGPMNLAIRGLNQKWPSPPMLKLHKNALFPPVLFITIEHENPIEQQSKGICSSGLSQSLAYGWHADASLKMYIYGLIDQIILNDSSHNNFALTGLVS